VTETQDEDFVLWFTQNLGLIVDLPTLTIGI
jgi:hypothetical protein